MKIFSEAQFKLVTTIEKMGRPATAAYVREAMSRGVKYSTIRSLVHSLLVEES